MKQEDQQRLGNYRTIKDKLKLSFNQNLCNSVYTRIDTKKGSNYTYSYCFIAQFGIFITWVGRCKAENNNLGQTYLNKFIRFLATQKYDYPIIE